MLGIRTISIIFGTLLPLIFWKHLVEYLYVGSLTLTSSSGV